MFLVKLCMWTRAASTGGTETSERRKRRGEGADSDRFYCEQIGTAFRRAAFVRYTAAARVGCVSISSVPTAGIATLLD